MRLLIQRSKESSVMVDNKNVGKINNGLVVFVGFTQCDNEKTIDKMVYKLLNLRIFEDDKQLMNLSLKDLSGEILSISQFTLYADVTKGNRPSFTSALEYKKAENLYTIFNNKIKNSGINVQTGIFGANMKVSIINDGPVTILIDSKNL